MVAYNIVSFHNGYLTDAVHLVVHNCVCCLRAVRVYRYDLSWILLKERLARYLPTALNQNAPDSHQPTILFLYTV